MIAKMNKQHQKSLASSLVYIAINRKQETLAQLQYAITQPMSNEDRLELKEEIKQIKQTIQKLLKTLTVQESKA
jgi:hypothetical protein